MWLKKAELSLYFFLVLMLKTGNSNVIKDLSFWPQKNG